MTTGVLSANNCRRAYVDPCDATPGPNGAIPALFLFRKAQGEKIDFGIDWVAWCKANRCKLENSTWSVATNSPSSPIVEDMTRFSESGETMIVLSGGNDGDTYYLDNTVTTTVVPAEGDYAEGPARTLVRRIHVLVDAGHA